MIVCKSIKPARLKDDQMRLTLLNAMRKSGTGIKKDFQETVKTWEHKPKFELLISLTGPGPVLVVGTDDEIYGYVNSGTKAHDIWAGWYTGKSDKKVLAFPSVSTPKTTPNVIGSGPGSRGPVDTFTPYVEHPGTKARNFDKAIQKKWEPKFKRDMEAAMREATRASGHGL